MRVWATLSLVALLLLCAAGCAREEAAADTAPFQAAVTSHLAANRMHMKVTRFESLEVAGETATAVCRLEEASGLYGMGVRWRFTFERDRQGWRATDHEAI